MSIGDRKRKKSGISPDRQQVCACLLFSIKRRTKKGFADFSELRPPNPERRLNPPTPWKEHNEKGKR
jgi:hypothetical protein